MSQQVNNKRHTKERCDTREGATVYFKNKMQAPEKTGKWKQILPHICPQPLFSIVDGVKRLKVELPFSVWGLQFH